MIDLKRLTPSCTSPIPPSPGFNYLYSSDLLGSPNGSSYLFPDSPDHMRAFSLIPPIELEGKDIIFTQKDRPVIWCENAFIYSLPGFFEKFTLPAHPNQEILDKIATIANYLAQGNEFEYVKESAKETFGALEFLVKKGTCKQRVSIHSFVGLMNLKKKPEFIDIDYEEALC